MASKIKRKKGRTGFALAELGLKLYTELDYFGELLGYRLKKANRKARTAEIELKVEERHLSPARKVHGGVLSALMDTGCAAAVATTLESEDRYSTMELKLNYFKPVPEGSLLRVQARVLYRGNRVACAEGIILKNEGKGWDPQPVAVGMASFHIASAKT